MAKIRRRKKRARKPRHVPLRAIIPNLMTLLSAASGVTSIRYSCNGQWEYAVIAILVSCILDGLDGRVARLLHVSSKLGEQLDSLADFVSFGVAPALLTYFWVMAEITPHHFAYPLRKVFWALALFYTMCSAFRLARFNIMVGDDPQEPYWRHFFLGLPAPGAACIVLTPLIWQIHTGILFLQSMGVGALMLLSCGILMACRAPTISLKHLHIPAKRVVPVVLGIIFILGMLVSQFWLTLGTMALLYLLSIPLCGLWFWRLKKRYHLLKEA